MGPSAAGRTRPMTVAALARELRVYEHACTMPARPAGLIDRERLAQRLTRQPDVALALVTGPAGSGKSCLVQQIAASDGRPVAWVTVDEHAGSPVAVLRHIAVALHVLHPLSRTAVAALKGSEKEWITTALPVVVAAMRAQPGVLLVIDDAHHLAMPSVTELLEVLVAGLPAGSTLVLASRVPPPLRLGRLQLSGRLVRLGAQDLALSTREATALAGVLDVDVPPECVQRVVEQMEGWVAGVRLGLLALQTRQEEDGGAPDQGTVAAAALDYLREELLDRQPEEVARFLRRTSILDHLGGPLCDAVLEADGSAELLAELGRDGSLFLLPIDERGAWFRVHSVFRELLADELERYDPALVPVLHDRASRWYEEHDDLDRAVQHATRGSDPSRAEDLVFAHVVDLATSGRNDTLGRWLSLFTAPECERSVPLCLAHAWFALGDGRPDDVEDWLSRAAALPWTHPLSDGTPSVHLAVSIMRSMVGTRSGPGLLAALGDLSAVDATTSPLCAIGIVLEGTIRWMMGEDEAAMAVFRRGEPGWVHLPVLRAGVLAYLALMSSERGDHVEAASYERRAHQTIDEHQVTDHVLMTNPLLALALVEARSGAKEIAEARIIAARRLLAGFGHLAPRSRLLAYALLAELHVHLEQLDGARTILAEAEPLAHREAWAVGLTGRLDRTRAELARRIRVTSELSAPGPASLTPAELRILAFLPTHLSLREIGDRVLRSGHTVKSQTVSVYRKLGVSGRSDAVARARELGLIE